MKTIHYEKELKVKLRRYKRILDTLNPEQQEILRESIETIELNLAKEKIQDTDSLEDALINEYDNLKEFESFWPIIEEFTDFIEDEDSDRYPYPDIDMSNKEILTLTYDFFKNGTSKYFFSLFEQLFKQRRKIHFVNSSVPGFYGDTLFLNYDKSFYVQIGRLHEFNDIVVMAHEYGHGIQYLINYNRNIFYGLFPFSEVVSIFFELICGDYYTKDLSLGNKARISLYDNWNTTCKDAQALNQEIQIFKSSKIKRDESTEKKKRRLWTFIENSDYNKLVDLIMQNPSSDFSYILAYSIATNLFMIYLRDPDYAFYLLKKLIEIDLNLSPETYLQEIIKLGIIPNEGLEEFDRHLNRELKRL